MSDETSMASTLEALRTEGARLADRLARVREEEAALADRLARVQKAIQAIETIDTIPYGKVGRQQRQRRRRDNTRQHRIKNALVDALFEKSPLHRQELWEKLIERELYDGMDKRLETNDLGAHLSKDARCEPTDAVKSGYWKLTDSARAELMKEKAS